MVEGFVLNRRRLSMGDTGEVTDGVDSDKDSFRYFRFGQIQRLGRCAIGERRTGPAQRNQVVSTLLEVSA